jgi:methyl-accepting chemotaxis protein
MIESSSETQDKVSDINNAINEQNRIREETATAIDNLTNFLQSISKEFENETRMIQSTTRGTQDIIDGITTVGEGISTAAQFTSSLSKLTQAGSEDMRKLMAVMKEIQDSSTEILGVATTLSTFAHKIDLLSMNASIEAAHSGEAGKGFAVIAHEIKELASQTSQWSAKIAEIITAIIGSIDNSADLTSKVNQALLQIEDGSVKSADRVNAAWEGMQAQQSAGNEIAKDASSLASSAAHMKTEIASQNKFATKVMNNMQELCQASQAVNEASSDISAFTENLGKEALNLVRLADSTAKVARELMEIMNSNM